jgi:hypothetical protein
MKMLSDRLLGVAGVVLLALVALPGALTARLAALAVLLLAVGGYLVWLGAHGELARLPRPAPSPDPGLAEIVAARVGEPPAAVCPFCLRLKQTPVEHWRGQERLWVALTSEWLWLLHQTPAGGIGGVKSRCGRRGLHARWVHRRLRAHHLAELSWPRDAWFMLGELSGNRAQRLRLMGLLAGDELELRGLVERQAV